MPRHYSENTLIVTGWTGYARKLPAELSVYQVELRTRKGGAKVAGEAGSDNPYYERGSPCEKVYVESFNARLKDWLLNEELIITLLEVKVMIENRGGERNTVRTHRALE